MRSARHAPAVRGGHGEGPSPARVRGSCEPGDVALSAAGRVVATAAVVVGSWALVVRSTDLVVVVAPLLFALAVDVAGFAPSAVTVRVDVERERCMEGRRLRARLRVRRAMGPLRWLPTTVSVGVQVPHPLRAEPGTIAAGSDGGAVARWSPGSAAVDADLLSADVADVDLVLRAPRWGGAGRWPTAVVWRSPLGLLTAYARTDLRGDTVRVLPSLRERVGLLEPPRAGAWSGVLPAPRRTGQGVEFAGLRPFRRGDRPRDVHARATARHGEPWVAERHPERNREVVLVLDQLGREALLDTVRVVTALADVHVGARDRVGLVGLGQPLRWVVPGIGERQRLKLLDAAMDVSAAVSQVEPRIERVPVAALPPGALVVLVAHLADRTEQVVRDLRGRRRDVVVLDMDVPRAGLFPRPPERRRRMSILDPILAITAGGSGQRNRDEDWGARRGGGPSDVDVIELAWRLHDLERAERRARCRAYGATVLRHGVSDSTAVVVAAVGRALRARVSGVAR